MARGGGRQHTAVAEADELVWGWGSGDREVWEQNEGERGFLEEFILLAPERFWPIYHPECQSKMMKRFCVFFALMWGFCPPPSVH